MSLYIWSIMAVMKALDWYLLSTHSAQAFVVSQQKKYFKTQHYRAAEYHPSERPFIFIPQYKGITVLFHGLGITLSTLYFELNNCFFHYLKKRSILAIFTSNSEYQWRAPWWNVKCASLWPTSCLVLHSFLVSLACPSSHRRKHFPNLKVFLAIVSSFRI